MANRVQNEPSMQDAAQRNLDPQAEALLALLARSPAQMLSSMPPPLLRTMLNEGMKAFALKNVHVGSTRDLTLPGPGGRIAVRLYAPHGTGAEPLPGLIFLHGGGFIAGDLDTHDGLCRMLANESGCRVVAVDYRLAPEHRFPAALDDAFAVLRWAYENAAAIHVQAGCLAVGGDSAGGTLAAVACHLARDAGLEIAAQMLLYPMTQLDPATDSRRMLSRGFFLEEQALTRCSELFLGPLIGPEDPRISPLLAQDLSGLPRAIVVTAGLDPLRDEACLYAERLIAAGVDAHHLAYERMFHGFLNAAGVLDTAKAALPEIGASLRATLV